MISPPPSLFKLVSDDIKSDGTWKSWLNLLYSYLENQSFLDLTDTPTTYTPNQYIRVNATGDGLEYATGASVAAYPGLFVATGSDNITSAPNIVNLNSEGFDPDAQYSVAAGVITVTTAGYYNIGYSVPVKVDTTGGGVSNNASLESWVEVNSGGGYLMVNQSLAKEAFQASNTSMESGVNASFIVQLSAGDNIRIMIQEILGADLSTLATITDAPQLSIHRVRA